MEQREPGAAHLCNIILTSDNCTNTTNSTCTPRSLPPCSSLTIPIVCEPGQVIANICKCTTSPPPETTTSQPFPLPTPTSRPDDDDKDVGNGKDDKDKET